MNESIFLAFANVDEGSIDTRQHVFNGAEVHISDLIAALGHHQFINTFVVENRGDPQLLGNDDLLGHGERDGARRARPGGKAVKERIWLKQIWAGPGETGRGARPPIPDAAMRIKKCSGTVVSPSNQAT